MKYVQEIAEFLNWMIFCEGLPLPQCCCNITHARTHAHTHTYLSSIAAQQAVELLHDKLTHHAENPSLEEGQDEGQDEEYKMDESQETAQEGNCFTRRGYHNIHQFRVYDSQTTNLPWEQI